jgi:4-hydroxybenzoate polyprenyltransferase
VLNDLHDFKRDLKERPERPLPSGKIRRWEALSLASGLLLVGIAPLWALGPPASLVGTLLVAAVIAYDVLVKDAPIAPAVMGLCRSLNLLLGMSLVPMAGSPADGAVRATLATVLGTYVLGITLFARREAARPPIVRSPRKNAGEAAAAAPRAFSEAR